MSVVLTFLCLVFVLNSSYASVLPVEKCKLDDSACMKNAFQKAAPIFLEGIPDLGIEVMDVMNMDPVVFDLSGLQFSLTDGKLKGLKNLLVDKVNWDLKKSVLQIAYHTNCSVKGHYVAGGRILILPITGDGQMKLKLKNVHIKLNIHYKLEKGPDGKNYVVPTKFTFDFEVMDGAHFTLTNLFNGNKELSDTMLLFLNQNWKQISSEFGRPMMAVAAKKIFDNVVIFLSKEALDDIAIL